MSPLVLLSAWVVAAASGPGPVPHSIAFVNDARSHGQVGDNLLSLNEAIRLHNQTLTFGQLSLAEQMQVSGFGQDVSWADIDAAVTPAIVMERDFDVILDRPHGLLISGFNGKVLFDFGPVTRGFVATSNRLDCRSLVLRGGPIGIDVTQTDASFGSMIEDVDFESQTVAALRCAMSTPGQSGLLIVDRCTFTNAAAGIVVDETPAGRSTDIYVGNCTLTGVQDGLRFTLGPGGTGLYEIEKLEIDAAANGIRFLRAGSGAGRTVLLETLHLDVRAPTALDFRGVPGAAATLVMRMPDLTSATGTGCALAIGPLGAGIGGTLDEPVLSGNVEILTGGAAALTVGNARIAGGSFVLGSTGSPLVVIDSVVDGAQTTTQGTAPVSVRSSSVVGGSVQGTAAAPLLFDTSHVGATVGAHVVQTNPVPAPMLGSMSVTPRRPVLGGAMTLQADLPPGLFGLFVMGATASTPLIQPRPLHVYLDPTSSFTVPGIYRLQQSLGFTVPVIPSLRGSDWVVQMGVFPDPGTVAPPLSLPPGRRFVLR